MLDLSANMNLQGPPAAVVDALAGDPGWLSRYVGFDEKAEAARLTAQCFETGACFIPTHGASPALLHLPRLLNATSVLHLASAFWEYSASATIAGVAAREHRLPEDVADGGVGLLSGTAGDGDVCILGNPNNPTGHLVSEARLAEIAKSNPTTTWIIDETYLRFRGDWRSLTCIPLTRKFSNVIVVVSLSKWLAIPGIRFGGIFCNPLVHEQIATKFFSFDISYSALQVLRLLDGPRFEEYISLTESTLCAAQIALEEFLERASCVQRFYKPTANFALVQLKKFPASGDDPAKWLLDSEGIRVRSGAELSGLDRSWLRFCFGLPTIDSRVRRALTRFSVEMDKSI